MKKRIVFKTNETIKENASRNNVSVSTIYRFLRSKGCSKRELNNRYIENTVLKLKEKSLKDNEIAKRLKISNSTVTRAKKRKSAKINNPLLDNILSYSFSQDEILCNISRLYLNNQTFDCDLTYSVGNFYKCLQVPEFKFDKYPCKEDVMPLEKAEDLIHQSFNSIVFDLPFLIQTESNLKWKLKIPERFGSFKNEDELFNANLYMLKLAYNLLKHKGILVVKTQNTRKGNSIITVHNFIIEYATHNLGFKLIDEFIRLHDHATKNKGFNNLSSRTSHCYFLVFCKMS